MATRRPLQDWTPAEPEQYFREVLAGYQGDSYIVDDLVESGLPVERARAQVQDPAVLKAYLEYDGLPDILADRLASNALKIAILERRPEVVDALISAAQKLKAPGKRGPKGKMVAGKYRFQQIAELRDNEGKSWGQIAMLVYGTKSPEKITLVKVQYRQAKQRMERPADRRA